jgi:hypothetical protein
LSCIISTASPACASSAWYALAAVMVTMPRRNIASGRIVCCLDTWTHYVRLPSRGGMGQSRQAGTIISFDHHHQSLEPRKIHGMRNVMEKLSKSSNENIKLNVGSAFTSEHSNVAEANSITAQISLIGDAGVGKTSLLTQYVCRNKNRPRHAS